MVKDIQTRSLR